MYLTLPDVGKLKQIKTSVHGLCAKLTVQKYTCLIKIFELHKEDSKTRDGRQNQKFFKFHPITSIYSHYPFLTKNEVKIALSLTV